MSKKTKKAARKAIRMLHDLTAFALLQQRVRQKFAVDMRETEMTPKVSLSCDTNQFDEAFEKVSNGLTDIRIHNLERENKALKQRITESEQNTAQQVSGLGQTLNAKITELTKRIETIEQKLHFDRKKEMSFEFDLEKNEVPFVRVDEGELIEGKWYVVDCNDFGSPIAILQFQRKYFGMLKFIDGGGLCESNLAEGANNYYQYCQTK